MEVDTDELLILIDSAESAGADFNCNHRDGKPCFCITGDLGTLWDFIVELMGKDPGIGENMGPPAVVQRLGVTEYIWPDIDISDEVVKEAEDEINRIEPEDK